MFCARLRDGHTIVDVPGELFLEMYARPSLDTRLIEGRVLVTAVWSDSLRRTGIRPGLEIAGVDSTAVRDYAARFVAPYASASTEQGLESSVFGLYLLCGSRSRPVRLELLGEDGRRFERVLPRDCRQILRHDRPVEFKRLPGDLAYVALNSFGSRAAVTAFDSLHAEFAETKGLILDVRQNTGGNSAIGWEILAYLSDRPFRTGMWQTRDYRPTLRASGMGIRWETTSGPIYAPHPSKRYEGRVAVLCGALTGSAAEDFLMAFDAMERGKIVGEPTGGSTGQPVSFALPGGGSGRVCGARTTYPDGTEYVGRGILPDVVVHPTAADVRQGRDAVLEAAANALASMASE
jgi:C-terminal processing protease CtpA/Prc